MENRLAEVVDKTVIESVNAESNLCSCESDVVDEMCSLGGDDTRGEYRAAFQTSCKSATGVAQFSEEELVRESVVVNFATTAVNGKYIGLIIICQVVKKLGNKWKKRKDYSKIWYNIYIYRKLVKLCVLLWMR